MSKNNWLMFLGFIVFISYLLPYTVLSDVNAWYGSFLVWAVAGLLVILANFMITKDFEEEAE